MPLRAMYEQDSSARGTCTRAFFGARQYLGVAGRPGVRVPQGRQRSEREYRSSRSPGTCPTPGLFVGPPPRHQAISGFAGHHRGYLRSGVEWPPWSCGWTRSSRTKAADFVNDAGCFGDGRFQVCGICGAPRHRRLGRTLKKVRAREILGHEPADEAQRFQEQRLGVRGLLDEGVLALHEGGDSLIEEHGGPRLSREDARHSRREPPRNSANPRESSRALGEGYPKGSRSRRGVIPSVRANERRTASERLKRAASMK